MRKNILILVVLLISGFGLIGANANRSMWDLEFEFDGTSGYQYGIASDGEYIYTSSWSASSTSMFYKYDMQGNFIEEFDISGCGQLRGMTYDGEYFYGVANASTIYCVDLANHTLVSQTTSAYGTMRAITYDPQRDGFWVVGNWSGDLTLVDRSGAIVQTGATPTSVSDCAYYMDPQGVEHVLCFNNGTNDVDDYNIATNSITSAVFNFNTNPLVTGSAGGCFVGPYNDKTCFFGDIQQSPQHIAIYELSEGGAPSTNITSIYIEGYTAPVYGQHPDYDVNVMAGEPYTIAEVLWWNDGRIIEPSDVYGDGQTYMRLELTPNPGYEFDEYAVAYFNGSNAIHDFDCNSLESDGTLFIYTIDYYLTHQENAVTYSFEGTFDGWTTIDADGDGFCWEQASVLMAGYSIPSHDGADCVTSQSYDGSYGALTPDNYLVSPSKAAYTEITFWACAQDAAWAAEHFGVSVSTGSNTNPADFTLVDEWTMTAKRVEATEDANVARKGRDILEGTWYEYTVDFSAYSGQEIWVAIRHFGCTDQFYINVDEVTLFVSGDGVAENNTNLFSVYPNPAKDNVMIESEVNVNRYDIYNVTGALVMSNEVNAETFTVNVEALPAGSYIIRLTSDGMIQNRSFIKK